MQLLPPPIRTGTKLKWRLGKSRRPFSGKVQTVETTNENVLCLA
uniref:Dual specificity tyrosine phosphorylation regulated kinase 4 n=1 Tax=Homo sapiens TaxID=9606 RepID=F5H3D3_HUMAN